MFKKIALAILLAGVLAGFFIATCNAQALRLNQMQVKHVEYFDSTGTPVDTVVKLPKTHLLKRIGIRLAPLPAFIVDTLQYNGAGATDITFVAEGYTEAEQVKFITDVQALKTNMFAQYPFNIYYGFFNIYAIHVVSQESGAKHPHKALDCPTLTSQPVSNPANYFGTTFDYSGIHRLLMPTNPTLLKSVLDGFTPGYEAAILLVNTPYYGGASEGAIATISAGDPTGGDICLHELGHSLAGLGDEYSYGGCAASMEEWNCTHETNPALVRWFPFFINGVPNANCTNVGLYQGAAYCPTGWYRPECNCKMRTLGQPFCRVCLQRMAYAFSYFTNLISSYAPLNSSISLTPGQQQPFSITTPRQLTNSLKVTWALDGKIVSGSKSYVLLNNSVPAGTHTLTVTAVDTTALSRILMKAYSRSWQVTTTGGTVPPFVCKAPVITAKDSARTSITVQWQAVDGALSYTTERKLHSATTWLKPLVLAGTAKQYGGLPKNTWFDVRVTAICKDGTSSSIVTSVHTKK